MQLRTIALVFSLIGLFYSGFVSALGLGEITLRSQFNQPLNAEIRLLKVRDLSKEEIFATLASREDFKRAGVDRLFLLSSLKFEVVIDNPLNPFIRVTSKKPITEPYLNFLVEVQWPSGRLLREYTLLLDLPIFNDSAANAPVTPPSKSAPVASPVPVPPRPQVSEPRSQVVPPSAGLSPRTPPATAVDNAASQAPHANSYKVKSGDTLWKIAASTLANSPASINQRMIAIQRANPEAFANGNINRLRNGRVLRIPSAQEVADVSTQQASSAVREQNQAWSSETKPAQKAVLTSAAPTAQTSASTGQLEGRLTLASASSGQSGKGSGASGSGESLQNELAIANDELARATRQNDELKARITELEAQIDTMENLVSVTNNQLKALQTASESVDDISVDNVASAVGDTGTEPTGAEAIDAGGAIDDVVAGESVAADDASQKVTEQPATVIEPTVVTEEAPKAPIAKEESNPFQTAEPATPAVFTPPKPTLVETIISFLKENILIVGGALLVLLAAIFFLLRLRNKPEESVDDFNLEDEGEDLFNLDEDNLEAPDELSDDVIEEDNLSVDQDIDLTVQAQTEDVVAEADIYVSLGQEDKAIELLQKEIQQNPDNADARLGLLKIYAKSQNSAGFDEQYAQLLPLGNVYANDQAMALRKEIENAEPFDTNQYSLQNNELDSSSDLDLDLDLDAVEEKPANDGSIAFTETGSDLNLDDVTLDLGELGDDVLDLDEEESPSESKDTDFSLDLDDLEDTTPTDAEDKALAASADSGDDLENIEFSLDLDEGSDSSTDDLSLDLDSELDDLSTKAPVDGSPTEADALEDIEFDLDLDMDDELNESVDELEDSLPLDDEEVVAPVDGLDNISADEGLDNDFSVELDGDLNDLDFEVPAHDNLDLSPSLDDKSVNEVVDIDLDSDLSLEDNGSELEEAEDGLDLDAPPPTDIDMASLDQEIDAMTADMDKLPIDDEQSAANVLEEEPVGVVEEELELESDDSLSQEPASSSLDINDASEDTTISQEDDLDFLEESDEVSTKLDLAKAYMDMGDREGAQDILNEVLEEGNKQQKSDAKDLIERL